MKLKNLRNPHNLRETFYFLPRILQITLIIILPRKPRIFPDEYKYFMMTKKNLRNL